MTMTKFLVIACMSLGAFAQDRNPSDTPVQVTSAAECVPREFYCPDNDPPTCATDCFECGNSAEFGNTYNKPPDAPDIAGTCEFRALFSSDYLAYDIAATVIWFIAAGFAMAAGVGGGGIYVPLGILIVRLGTKQATGLSQASIFGASIAGYIINMCTRHPLADRPVINFDMALFLAPMEIAGATVGILVQEVLPDLIVIILMAVILGFTAYKTLKKGIKDWRRQQRIKNNTSKASMHTAASEIEMPVREGTDTSIDGMDMIAADVTLDPNKAAVKKSPLISDASNQAPADAQNRTSGNVILVFQFLFMFVFGTIMGRRAVSKSMRKAAVNYPFVKGDIQWNWPQFFFYSFFTFVAGVIAGLIGIGGGMVLGPLMLQLGVLPQVSTATTATMIGLTSSVAAIMFVTAGEVQWNFAVYFFGIAFAGAFVGKTLIDRIVKKYSLSAALILILGAIILIATILITVVGGIDISDDLKNNVNIIQFQSFCPS